MHDFAGFMMELIKEIIKDIRNMAKKVGLCVCEGFQDVVPRNSSANRYHTRGINRTQLEVEE